MVFSSSDAISSANSSESRPDAFPRLINADEVFGTHRRTEHVLPRYFSSTQLRRGASLRRAGNRQYRQAADALRSMNQHSLDVGGRGRPRN